MGRKPKFFSGTKDVASHSVLNNMKIKKSPNSRHNNVAAMQISNDIKEIKKKPDQISKKKSEPTPKKAPEKPKPVIRKPNYLTNKKKPDIKAKNATTKNNEVKTKHVNNVNFNHKSHNEVEKSKADKVLQSKAQLKQYPPSPPSMPVKVSPKRGKKVKNQVKEATKRPVSSDEDETVEPYSPPPKRNTRENELHKRLHTGEFLKPGELVALECQDKDYDFYLMMLTEAPFTNRREVSDDYGCTFEPNEKLIRGRYLEKVGKDRYVYKVEPKKTAYAHLKEIIAVVPMEIIQASRNMCYYLLDRDIYIAVLQQM